MRERAYLHLLSTTSTLAKDTWAGERSAASNTRAEVYPARKSRLAWVLHYAGIELSPRGYILCCVLAGLALMLGCWNIGPIFAMAIGVCVTFELIVSHPRDAAARRERSVARHLPLCAELLGERISSGVPFATALTDTTKALPEGILRRELEILLGDIQRGVATSTAVGDFRSRLSGPEIRAFCSALKLYCLGGSQLGEPIKKVGAFIREHRLVTDAVARRVHTVRQTFAVILSALALGGIFLIRFLPQEVVYANHQYAVMTREIGGLLLVASLVAVMRVTAERFWEIDDVPKEER